MACCTASCASFASAMAFSFSAFDAARSSVAVAKAAWSSATELVSSATRWLRSAMVASSCSFCAVSWLTSSDLDSRVCLLLASSASHQPLCSVSAVASSMSLTMRSLISFLTFTKGSAAARSAAMASTWLPVARARADRNATACCCCCGLARSLRSAASALRPDSCAREGRCFSPAPATVPLEMISIAFATASSSSWRSVCLDSKSACFTLQRASVSSRYRLSSSL
mmetsp:Transcript_126635/g.343772  ORF Transcript_126635/g.343772 Transcript_126635/m.343772 type:complete len:226 (-) Transcript_126635:1064-1741(-)